MVGWCVTIPFEAACFRFPYLSPLCTTVPALTRFIYPDALLAPSASVDDDDLPSNQESARSFVATTGPGFQRQRPFVLNKGLSQENFQVKPRTSSRLFSAQISRQHRRHRAP